MDYFTPKDPNNIRNRYRRAMATHNSYGWSPCTFREWIRLCHDVKTAYSVGPHYLNFSVCFLKAMYVKWKK